MSDEIFAPVGDNCYLICKNITEGTEEKWCCEYYSTPEDSGEYCNKFKTEIKNGQKICGIKLSWERRNEGKMRVYIGIDPGMNGGIAVLRENGEIVEYMPMPSTAREVANMLKPYANLDVIATVEKVGSMPKQGVVSTFKFGKEYGVVLGVCNAYGFRLLDPTPQAWKKAMLAGTDKSKWASIERCSNLFPDVNLIMPRCRVPHDGVAEAILLAEYGRREEK